MSRGFTLIELLVVIAIIGMLSSVIIGSLRSAQGKGANAAVKSNLANLKTEAQLFYENNTPAQYTGLCSAPRISKFISAINLIITPNTVVCSTVNGPGGGATNQQGYFVYAQYKTPEVQNGTTYTHWCIDYLGVSKALTTTPVTPLACP